MSNLRGLEHLASVGSLYVAGSPALLSLDGLEHLRRVDDLLELLANAKLGSLQGLSSLTNIGGDFLVVSQDESMTTIAFGSALSSLAGLEHVTHVGGSLSIQGQLGLTSLGPLLAWPHDTVTGSLRISENAKLSSCDIMQFDAAQDNAAAVCACSGGTPAVCN